MPNRKLKAKIKTISAGAFKSKCLALIDEVQAKRQPVIITRHGKPVAKLVPVDAKRDDFFGFMKGKVEILGDIVSPVIPLEEWNLD